MKPRTKWFASFFLAAVLCAPAWATATSANSALPGTLNYIEGQATIGSQTLDSKSVGAVELQPGQSLVTGKGKVEVLLTPGVFLRVGDNSSVKMISPGLTDTEIGIEQGQAMIEVAEIHPENDIRVNADGTTTRLLKTGLYDFDQGRAQLRVFDGKAAVMNSAHHTDVKGGREVALAADSPLKAQKFDKKMYEEGDLYRWSSLRSGYLAEANADAARIYVTNGAGPWGPGWWGAGWYWDPWFSAFTFIPGDGIFYSPFGWGFYSPWLVYRAPFFGYGYGFHGGVPFHHHFSSDVHNWGPGTHYAAGHDYAHGVYHGPGSTGSGFHSGPRMVGSVRGGGSFGGGFHGGGGGFHGGGGGGHR